MPIAITTEQRAVADSIRAWAANARPAATAREQESVADAWRKHWSQIADLGVFAVALPEDRGGAGGSVLDLAVMVEAAAQALVPGPILPTVLGGLILAHQTSAPLADLLRDVAAGARSCGIAFGESSLRLRRRADGALELSGAAATVLGADGASALVLPAQLDQSRVWLVVDPHLPGLTVHELTAADFSRPLARVSASGVEVAEERILQKVTDALVDDLALVLFAAEAAGTATWCLQTAVDYAKVREQFGAPIGSFQAVKHLCAEMLCRAELAAAVAWDAAQAAGEEDQRPVAAAAAGAIALDAAVETAKDCIQVLGGVGFSWEHDAHLYLRRAMANRQLIGGSGRWRRRATHLTLRGVRRALHIELGPEAQDERTRIRFQVESIAALPIDQRRAALADAGYLAPHYPEPYGLAASPARQLMIQQELARADVARPDLVIAGWAIPTILQFGTPAQIERFVTASLHGDVVWCQLFSEPGAGSDLASLRTRAERVEGGWRLTGQKVWTSVARQAQWAVCLARTNPTAPKHKGITYFLVDMGSPGLDIRPLREITGEAMFNEVFLDGVIVPDDMVVGDVDDGWKLARTTLVNERIAMAGGPSLGDAVEELVAVAEEHGEIGDPSLQERLGGLIATGLAGSLLDVRATLRQLHSATSDIGAESSVRKLVGVRHRQAVAEAGLDLIGAAGAVANDVFTTFLMTRCLTIAGGTTQVLLTLAGERLLGLPRA